jgi:acylglycerol lipase
MNYASSSLKTADNLTLHTVAWLPETEPKAVVVIVHGYAEHIGRYPHVAEALVNAGYAVYGLDHRGHGKSEGLQAYFADFEDAVHDLRRYVEQVQAKHPGKKLFLYGHSMGSLIAMAYTLRHQNELAGLAISGCAINGDEIVPGLLIGLGQFVKSFAPTLPMIPGLPSSELSTDLSVGEAYDKDPMIYRGLWRVGMGIGLIIAGRKIRDQLGQFTLPLLIMHGEADKITPISGSRLTYERAKSTDKTLFTYPEMRHEVMNEREKEKPLGALVDWLNKH